MKYIISERQYSLLVEQSMFGWSQGLPAGEASKAVDSWNESLDSHTLATIMQIGTAFIPYVGIFISAGIGLADAAVYDKEGDEKTAAVTAAFSMLPFAASIVTKIPGIKQLGVKGMAALGNKIAKRSKYFSKAEIEIANAVKNYSKAVQEELAKMAPKLTQVMKEVNLYKPNFVKKYGEEAYNKVLKQYLYSPQNNESKIRFINALKNVKNPTLRVKPIMGAGSDHQIFQSIVNPNVVFKAEVRPGEVVKWYDTFKKYPNLFAKPIKMVKVRGSDGTLLNAVAMEKLQTSPFVGLWEDLTNVGKKFGFRGTSYNNRELETVLKNLGNQSNKQKWDNIVIEAKKQLPQLSKKIDEFKNLINSLYKITPTPDIRQFNFGYDTKGILKALDL